MLEVKVILHSARTGEVREIANMIIYNDVSGTPTRGNYGARVYRQGDSYFKKGIVRRTGTVRNYPRMSKHVWNLVARMLKSMNYG